MSSSFGRDGGKEGLYEYLKPKWMSTPITAQSKTEEVVKKFGGSTADRPRLPGEEGSINATTIDHTIKNYVGGAQKRPDGGYAMAVLNEKNELVGRVVKDPTDYRI